MITGTGTGALAESRQALAGFASFAHRDWQ